MRIAITTPSGHVGTVVVDTLLDLGSDIQVKLLARRPHTLTKFVQRGAKTAIGALDDPEYLIDATRDVDALFWATPPGYGSDNVRAFQNRLGKAAAKAIRTNKIDCVVNLSSIGAENDAGVGPINGLHDVEQILSDAAANITHLRPGFFFENLLWQIDSIRTSGTICLPVSGSRRYPMIATRDIGRVAAKRLASPNWTGQNVRELHGPADLSFDEAAAAVSQGLGHKVTYVKCNRDQARQAMLAGGVSDNAADLMLELYDAVESGRLRPMQTRSAETTTPTTLAEFAREVMLPKVAQPVSH